MWLARCASSPPLAWGGTTRRPSFTTATVSTRCMRSANRRVDSVSSWSASPGDTAATRAVLELPPKLLFNSHVSTESRKGMCAGAAPDASWADDEASTLLLLLLWLSFLARACMSLSARMQLPSADRLLLMEAPSSRRRPRAPVAATRSLPARSTKSILDTRSRISPPGPGLDRVTVSCTIVWALLLVVLHAVAATVRSRDPSSRTALKAPKSGTGRTVSPST